MKASEFFKRSIIPKLLLTKMICLKLESSNEKNLEILFISRILGVLNGFILLTFSKFVKILNKTSFLKIYTLCII